MLPVASSGSTSASSVPRMTLITTVHTKDTMATADDSDRERGGRWVGGWACALE